VSFCKKNITKQALKLLIVVGKQTEAKVEETCGGNSEAEL
jgi:hypothetical protein